MRAELSRAAWDLFTHKGYEKTTVAEIARATGVSRRTFFRYHASKEDVLVATSDAFAQAMLDAVAARPAERASARRDPPRARARPRAGAGTARFHARHHPSAAREPGAPPRDAGPPRADGGAARGAASPSGSASIRSEDSTPALLAFLARAMLRHGLQRLVRPGPRGRGGPRRRAVRQAARADTPALASAGDALPAASSKALVRRRSS